MGTDRPVSRSWPSSCCGRLTGGYATEAGQAVVTWVGEAGYRRLWAGVRDWNVASRRVLEKLGFRETGRVQPDAVHGDNLLTVREF
jgi:RimJ/RimL family protein N-acetyltransferase